MSAGLINAARCAKRMAKAFTAGGLPCEIEAGPIGLLVYGASKATVAAVAGQLARTARRAGHPSARIEAPEFDASGDEPIETAWVCTVRIDWSEAIVTARA